MMSENILKLKSDEHTLGWHWKSIPYICIFVDSSTEKKKHWLTKTADHFRCDYKQTHGILTLRN